MSLNLGAVPMRPDVAAALTAAGIDLQNLDAGRLWRFLVGLASVYRAQSVAPPLVIQAAERRGHSPDVVETLHGALYHALGGAEELAEKLADCCGA